jgi:single-strand DNA-binding protein
MGVLILINEVRLMGYLGADPEKRTTPNNFTYARIPVSLYRSGSQERGNWIQCEAWNRVGEIILNIGKKGSRVIVEGELRVDTWRGENDEIRSRTYIRVRRVIFPDYRTESNQNDKKTIDSNKEFAESRNDISRNSKNDIESNSKNDIESNSKSDFNSTPSKEFDPFEGLAFEEFDLDQ